MKNKKNKVATFFAFAVLFTVCLSALILDHNDRSTDVYPDENTMICLYGEAHGFKEYYDIEFELWKNYYDEGCRDLFVELPYYSAEFLNLWMKDDSDLLLDSFFAEIKGTLSGNEYYYVFLQNIKNECPQTIFHGTDVGHQYDTTGRRYLKYLDEHDLKGSENYLLAEKCIRQGEEFYNTRTQNNGMSPVREKYMVENFIDAYKSCGGRIMGIYGSYHTDLSAADLMAGRLKAEYGDIISSVKLSTLAFNAANRDPYEPGFCFCGLLYLLMLFIPNFIWTRNKPLDYEEAEKKENRILLLLERIGQAAATVSVLIFPSIDPLVKKLPEGIFFRWNILLLICAFFLMVLYECYWIRYFRSGHTMADMYSSFAGFPLAGASLPVIALFLMGIYSRNLIVLLSSVILGIGHIGIHLQHKKDIGPSVQQQQY